MYYNEADRRHTRQRDKSQRERHIQGEPDRDKKKSGDCRIGGRAP